MIKKILIGLLIAFVIIQFIRPEKNISDDQSAHLSKNYDIPAPVNAILKVACNDCHSNKTRYPWYANVQPGAWYLNNHIEHGKSHLNFSTFTNLRLGVQNHKFEEIIEEVKEGEMPLASYTYLGLHSEANLTQEQRTLLVNWAQEQMDMLKATYPADSLVLRRRK
ncbi:MAG: heme-binding domain-containing protein [Cyclobacteriaceae bacterium]